jgi:hypothetical protein
VKDTKIGILNRQIWRLVLEARPYLVLAPFVTSLELREGHMYFQAHSDRSDSDLEFRLDCVVPGTVQLLPAKVTSAEKPRHPSPL